MSLFMFVTQANKKIRSSVHNLLWCQSIHTWNWDERSVTVVPQPTLSWSFDLGLCSFPLFKSAPEGAVKSKSEFFCSSRSFRSLFGCLRYSIALCSAATSLSSLTIPLLVRILSRTKKTVNTMGYRLLASSRGKGWSRSSVYLRHHKRQLSFGN